MIHLHKTVYLHNPNPANMKISQISNKLIKPLSPTPPSLNKYSISFLDQCMEPMNFAVVMFYQSKPENSIIQLEQSLAKILVQFYPLAGRYIKNDHIVDCSDQGVEFVEAEALDVELLDLIVNIETEQLNALLPHQYFRVDEAAPLLSIQASHFPGGGQAIAISVRHTVFDMCSLSTFIAAWSSATNPVRTTEIITPSFDLPKLIPYKDHDFGITTDNFSCHDQDLVVKRLFFDKAALMRLRSKLNPNHGGKTISRVRAVCAFIAKTLIRLNRGNAGEFVVVQSINMRERMIPPPPKHACGNLAIITNGRIDASEGKEIGLQELADLLGESVWKSIADCAGILSPNHDGRDIIINTYTNFFQELGNPDSKSIVFTDWSKFGFYQVDFGFGKPVWTAVGPQRPIITTAILMNNREGDGIEAWLHLNKNDMLIFEQDEEIKLFTT
uniref:Acyltransferase ACT2 n=1 Tax=Plectranthus barbatus TaxID=41228 RepID=A0A1B0VTE5_9LAMI|nr:acyltransferase ACT2 [Plectranthus barbatus]